MSPLRVVSASYEPSLKQRATGVPRRTQAGCTGHLYLQVVECSGPGGSAAPRSRFEATGKLLLIPLSSAVFGSLRIEIGGPNWVLYLSR